MPNKVFLKWYTRTLTIYITHCVQTYNKKRIKQKNTHPNKNVIIKIRKIIRCYIYMLYRRIADGVFLLSCVAFCFVLLFFLRVFSLLFSIKREVHLRSTFTMFLLASFMVLALHFMRNAKISSQLK